MKNYFKKIKLTIIIRLKKKNYFYQKLMNKI